MNGEPCVTAPAGAGCAPEPAEPAEAGHTPGPDAADCSVCLEFDWAEEDAERVGDLSLATDCRVLRRRHQAAEHPAGAACTASAQEPVEAARTASAEARPASTN
ncbi:hypothetical protein [Streptomyces sp. NPDC008125]|uniref:hypothetical protein n=1 Tax=Streptomyces sp. NPDC008125 TaxID=3364811 RepID=UPI0036E98E16